MGHGCILAASWENILSSQSNKVLSAVMVNLQPLHGAGALCFISFFLLVAIDEF